MTESRTFFDGRVVLHAGDCREVLRGIGDNSIDSVCCDPPYHLQSITRRFAKVGRTDKTWSSSGPHQRTATGFMNRTWDGGDIAFQSELWAEVLRVLKPGGYIMAFSGCRTYHRMACAIEDAGFITHPMFAWCFGSGFPKAHNVSRQIDMAAGAIKPRGKAFNMKGRGDRAEELDANGREFPPPYRPITIAAREWDGWFYGTQSLKPALEPVYFGQKPFEKGLNGAQNVQKWGTGAINVGACKIPSGDLSEGRTRHGGGVKGNGSSYELPDSHGELGPSRWPANLIHDGSEEVLACFPETTSGTLTRSETATAATGNNGIYGAYNGAPDGAHFDGSSGSAARFFASFPQEDVQRIFYTSKADSDDRLGSKHPTVKPLDLLQYLVRLITPPNGICLDLFAGTGTTGEACFREGFRAILIEREAEYIADIERRMSLVMEGPVTRAHASMKTRGRPRDDGPLFDLLDLKIKLAEIAVASGCDLDVSLTKPADGAAE